MLGNIPRSILKIFPFWVFVLSFKLSAGLHFSLLSVLGERVFPLWLVGLLIGGSAFIQVMLDVPSGYLLDRFGYIRLLRVGTLFFIAASAVFFLGLTPFTYVVSIVLGTAGWLFFSPGINAYVLLKAERRNAGLFIATRDVVESAGIVVATLLLPISITLITPKLGVVLIVPFVIGFAALAFTPPDKGSVHDEKKIAHQSYHVRRHFLHHIWKAVTTYDPASTLLMFSGFSSSLFYGVIWFVVPLVLARANETGPLDFGLMIFDGSVLITGFFVGRLTDRWDKRWLIFSGLLIFAVSGLLLGINFGVLFLILGFLATTGDEISSVSLWAWLDHLDSDHTQDALISGSISLCDDLGWSVGPVIAGVLFEAFGPAWTIAAGSAFIFVTWAFSSYRLAHLHQPAQLIPTQRLHIPRKYRHKK